MKILQTQISTKSMIILMGIGIIAGPVLALIATKSHSFGQKSVSNVQYYFPETSPEIPQRSVLKNEPTAKPEENLNKTKTSEFCAEVITPAINTRTKEVRQFPTPCDVPEGWEPLAE